MNRPYLYDELNTSIPLANSISLGPGSVNLPLRAVNHGALPAYFVAAGSAVLGETPLGYRALHVAASLCTVALVYLLAWEWYGPTAARWAAALLAFNEYYASISARATAHVPYLLFVTAALFAFSRFIERRRAAWLYAAGVAVALAFYCKEHSALLLPLFFVTLCRVPYRRWLRTPHAYLAAALFALLISGDVYWNLTTNPDTARVTYGADVRPQATYRSHLERVGGVGVSPYPLAFYTHDAVMWLSRRVSGHELDDNTPEYASMNPALGLLLLGAVALTAFRHARDAEITPFLLLVALAVFGFFSAVKPGHPGGLDPVSWIWVDMTMIPAVVLAGARLARARGMWRMAAWSWAIATLLYACARTVAVV